VTCNTGTLVGTIVTDIEQKVVNDNLTVVSFRVAPCNARENDSPIPVVAYNAQATRLFTRSNKGDTMSFNFRLRYVTWFTPEDEPRGRMEVIVYSSDMIRLGQISTQLRAEAAAGVNSVTPEVEPSAELEAAPEPAPAKAKRKVVASRTKVTELTEDELPF
jgi:single-stranded DNA-binding protein